MSKIGQINIIIPMLERIIRLNSTLIQNYVHQSNQQIKNEGYIDKNKATENTRILSLNS